MKNVYAVLKQKEMAMKRVRREIQALRLVCHMMESEKDSRPNSIRITLESSPEPEQKMHVVSSAEEKAEEKAEGKKAVLEKMHRVSPAEEKKAVLEQIRARFVERPPKEIKKENGRSVLLQFRQAALNASHTFLKRVCDSRLWDRETQQGIRDLLERFGRAA